MKSFYLEMKSVIKNYFTIVFIIILVLFTIFTMKYFDYRENQIINQKKIVYDHYTLINNNERLENSENKVLTLGEYKKRLLKQVSETYNNGDYKNYNLNMAKLSLLLWEQGTVLSENWNKSTENNRKISPQKYFHKDLEKIKDYLNYPTFSQEDNKISIDAISNFDIMMTFHYLDLIENNLPEQYNYSTRPWSIVYNFLQNGFAKIIVIISLIFGASVFSKQFESGTIKTKLSLSINRNKCLLNSYHISISSIIIVFLIPLIFIFIIQAIRYGVSGFDYPVLLDKYVIENWHPDSILPLYALNKNALTTIGLSTFIESGTSPALLERIIFIPLWKNILLTLLIVILSMLFWCSIGFVVSVFCKKTLKSILVSIGIYIFSYLPAVLCKKLVGTIYDLPKLSNISHILQGFQKVTVLQIVLLYIIGIIICLSIAFMRFRRVEITE